jgi:hypothetical protein
MDHDFSPTGPDASDVRSPRMPPLSTRAVSFSAWASVDSTGSGKQDEIFGFPAPRSRRPPTSRGIQSGSGASRLPRLCKELLKQLTSSTLPNCSAVAMAIVRRLLLELKVPEERRQN